MYYAIYSWTINEWLIVGYGKPVGVASAHSLDAGRYTPKNLCGLLENRDVCMLELSKVS